MPRSAGIPVALCSAWLLLWQAHALGLAWIPVGPVTWVHLVVMAIGASLCLVRAARVADERAAWALIGTGLLSWIAGETYFTVALWDEASPPIPSPADAGFLLMPPLMFAGLVLLLRSRVRGLPTTLWVDGITAALAVGSVSAAIVVEAVLDAAEGGDRLAVATNVAYPVADIALLGLIVAAVAARGWRIDRTLGLMIAGIVSFWLSDSLYLVLTAKGQWQSGGPFDVGWWATAVFFGAAAWQPAAQRVSAAAAPRSATIVAPVMFALIGLNVLVVGSTGDLNLMAISLAAASLVAVLARLLLTHRANMRMLGLSRVEARTDSLTGLGNRRALATDLAHALDPGAEDHGRVAALALFDLDGFKRYNDSFGHPSGDALLARLGARLARTVDGHGRAYRMGGDEFCVLLERNDELALATCSSALQETGEGFVIGCSHGVVLLPHEACDPSEALRIADQRLYEAKSGRRPSPHDETKAVMLRILAERDPELSDHLTDVAALAEAVAGRLGLAREQVDHVRIAAELHDVGKIAIPDEILLKPGPLDAGEWRFMERHTLIGERIIGGAPGLAPVAAMVRSSHERWDGRGYPDRLAGHEIPLGARIVAVCDAYDAMTKDRSYRDGMEPERALRELRRCAGTQFDPAVVDAFEHAVRAHPGRAREAA